MSSAAIGLILISQICLVAGQIWLKHAMNETTAEETRKKKFALHFALGIAAMTLWFLLWLGLMRHFDLSYLYPFEGLSPLFMAAGASFFLKEKMTYRLWIGILLISAGLALVSAS